MSEKLLREGKVFSSVRETIALLLNGFLSPINMLSLSRNEKQSTQSTMKEYHAVRRCFTSLRIKLFLPYYDLRSLG
jgi:hypothetical protein